MIYVLDIEKKYFKVIFNIMIMIQKKLYITSPCMLVFPSLYLLLSVFLLLYRNKYSKDLISFNASSCDQMSYKQQQQLIIIQRQLIL